MIDKTKLTLEDLYNYIESIWNDKIETRDKKVQFDAVIECITNEEWHYYKIPPFTATGRAGFVLMYNYNKEIMPFFQYKINGQPLSRELFLAHLKFEFDENGQLRDIYGDEEE